MAVAEDTAKRINLHDELVEQVRLFGRVIEYNIKVAEKKGDDEGARLQSFTLHQVRELLAKVDAS
jgi:hypothetical protein